MGVTDTAPPAWPALPLAAVIVGTMLERGLGDAVLAGVAVTLSVLSGCAAVDAILRTDWHL